MRNMGFALIIPSNWRITGDDNLDVYVGKPIEGVDDDIAGLEMMFRWHFETFGKDINAIENFEINGYKAIKMTYPGNQKGFNGFSFYVIKNSDNYLAIDTFNYDGKEREQSDKIINEIVRSVTFF